jgi:rubredoxin
MDHRNGDEAVTNEQKVYASHFDQLDDMVTCPVCERYQDEAECFLGRLGNLTRYCCRYCGMVFNSDGGSDS